MKRFLPYVSIPLILTAISCSDANVPDLDFKQEMKSFVKDLSAHAKSSVPGFIIIPQNGQELLTLNGDNEGSPDLNYMDVIDGQGREDFLYGYNKDDKETPSKETDYMADFLDMALANDIQVLVTDYCYTHSNMDNSYARNMGAGYISFAADHRELDNIPDYPSIPNRENKVIITGLSGVKNFLYLINPEQFSSKRNFIQAVISTNYDLLIMDLFMDEDLAFSFEEIAELKFKANGGKRLVMCYLSIGEAEDYRYYWENDWIRNPPSWMHGENPDWAGNYKVFYWEKEWQDIIFGTEGSYLDRILDAGFDGVYMDIIDAFEYFEDIKG